MYYHERHYVTLFLKENGERKRVNKRGQIWRGEKFVGIIQN